MEIPIIILFSMENGKREHKIAFKSQPSDWAQPHHHPNSKSASSPLWIGMHQQWLIFEGGLTINWFSVIIQRKYPYFDFNPKRWHSCRVCIHKRQDRVEHSHNVIRIQKAHPMDGHGPTMVNIWSGSIVLYHMSPWNEPTKYNWAQGGTPSQMEKMCMIQKMAASP